MEYLNTDYSYLFGETDIHKIEQLPDRRVLIKNSKKQFKINLKKENFDLILKELPEPGEALHLLSNGTYNLMNFIIFLTEKFKVVDELFISTWATSTTNVNDLLKFFDNGIIKNLNVLLGDYHKFKSRAEFGMLANGLMERKQRFCIFNNHVKLIIARKDADYIVVESSANLTSNPRLELHTISNNADLYTFHEQWMLQMLKSKNEKTFKL